MTGQQLTRQTRQSAGTPSRTWGKLGAGIGALGAEGTVGYLHPAVGIGLAIVDVAVPTIIALVLLVAVLRGSKETCERVFRLLRWIADRPEPPQPDHGSDGNRSRGS